MDGKREPTLSPKNDNHDRVAYLFSIGSIDERQNKAGQMLAKDWEMSQIQPTASTVLVGASGGAPQLPNDAKCDAMCRHGDAVAALGYNWPIVALVIEHNFTIKIAARMLNINEQRAMGALCAALHVLADHYRLPGKPQHDVVAKILAARS